MRWLFEKCAQPFCIGDNHGHKGQRRVRVFHAPAFAHKTCQNISVLPGARDGAGMVSDRSGNLWLFGGTAFVAAAPYPHHGERTLSDDFQNYDPFIACFPCRFRQRFIYLQHDLWHMGVDIRVQYGESALRFAFTIPTLLCHERLPSRALISRLC